MFGNEVQDLGHLPILDDGHALDRALALHPDAVDIVAAAGAAQLAQTVETGQSGHGALLPFNCPTEEGEALQVDVGQVRTHAHSKSQSPSDIKNVGRLWRHKGEKSQSWMGNFTAAHHGNMEKSRRPPALGSLHLSPGISRGGESVHLEVEMPNNRQQL